MPRESHSLQNTLGWLAREAYADLVFLRRHLGSRPSYRRLHDQKLARWTLYSHLVCQEASTSWSRLLRYLNKLMTSDYGPRAHPLNEKQYAVAWDQELKRLRDQITDSVLSRVSALGV